MGAHTPEAIWVGVPPVTGSLQRLSQASDPGGPDTMNRSIPSETIACGASCRPDAIVVGGPKAGVGPLSTGGDAPASDGDAPEVPLPFPPQAKARSASRLANERHVSVMSWSRYAW